MRNFVKMKKVIKYLMCIVIKTIHLVYYKAIKPNYLAGRKKLIVNNIEIESNNLLIKIP